LLRLLPALHLVLPQRLLLQVKWLLLLPQRLPLPPNPHLPQRLLLLDVWHLLLPQRLLPQVKWHLLLLPVLWQLDVFNSTQFIK
jgi:hypothetical protein